MDKSYLNRSPINGLCGFKYNDGGRADAGYKGHARDCVTRAIAIATKIPYQEVYDALNVLGKKERLTKRYRKRSSSREGVFRKTYQPYLESLGWSWKPLMSIGSGCKYHLREDELPKGRIILSVSGHLCTVIDGTLHDTDNCSRDGTRCVYGYYYKEERNGQN